MIEQCARCINCEITTKSASNMTFDCLVNAMIGSTYNDCGEFVKEDFHGDFQLSEEQFDYFREVKSNERREV